MVEWTPAAGASPPPTPADAPPIAGAGRGYYRSIEGELLAGPLIGRHFKPRGHLITLHAQFQLSSLLFYKKHCIGLFRCECDLGSVIQDKDLTIAG